MQLLTEMQNSETKNKFRLCNLTILKRKMFGACVADEGLIQLGQNVDVYICNKEQNQKIRVNEHFNLETLTEHSQECIVIME